MDETEKIYLAILLITIPVCITIRKLIHPEKRTFVTGFCGLLVTSYICTSMMHLLISTTAFALLVFPKSVSGPLLPILAFGSLYPFRYFVDLDGPSNAMLLVVTLRSSMFGWDLVDDLTPHSSKLDLIFNQFFPYIYALPGIFTGPVLPHSLFVKGCNSEKPVEWKTVGKLIGLAAASGLMNLALAPSFKYLRYGTMSGWETLGLLLFAPTFFRFRCYFAWYLSEAALTPLNCVEGCWGTNFSNNLLGLERETHLKKTVIHWNASVQGFLGKYVYAKLKGWKISRRLLTFLLCGWWHGTDAGIYVFFVGYPISQFLEGYYYSYLPEPIAWLQCQWITNLLTAGFIYKNDMTGFIELSLRTHHAIPIGAVLAAALGWALSPTKIDNLKDKKIAWKLFFHHSCSNV